MAGRRDPEIRLQKSEAVTLDSHADDPRTHHPRPVDVGRSIEVLIPSFRAGSGGKWGVVEYYGEYIGHGLSKTAFELHCPGQRFHGNVLKITKSDEDMEPEVFTNFGKHGLTTSTLYNCTGVDGGKFGHC